MIWMILLRRRAGDRSGREVWFRVAIVTLPHLVVVGSADLYSCEESWFVARLLRGALGCAAVRQPKLRRIQ